MSPERLRCEVRRPGGGGAGAWRYSFAALIVLAALLDVLWWVPAQQRARQARDEAREAPVQLELSPCRQLPPEGKAKAQRNRERYDEIRARLADEPDGRGQTIAR